VKYNRRISLPDTCSLCRRLERPTTRVIPPVCYCTMASVPPECMWI